MSRNIDKTMHATLMAVAEVAVNKRWKDMEQSGFGQHSSAIETEKDVLSKSMNEDKESERVKTELKNHFVRNAMMALSGWINARLSNDGVHIQLYEGEFKAPKTLQNHLASVGFEAVMKAAPEHGLDFKGPGTQR